MATGVLVCGVERGTKLLGHLALDTKAYTATIRLGATTTTDDAEGETVTTTDPSAVTDEAIGAGVAALTGPILQVPSSVSAIKIDGRRAYARVRAGEQVVLPPRPVTVSTFTRARPARRRPGRRRRVLVRDLRPGTGPRPRRRAGRRRRTSPRLRRTRVGPFRLEHARTLPELEELRRASPCRWPPPWRPPSPGGTSTPPRRADLSHGRPLPGAGLPGTYGVFAPDGRVLALVAERDGAARPVVVLAPAGG